jgi:hypothetical protein
MVGRDIKNHPVGTFAQEISGEKSSFDIIRLIPIRQFNFRQPIFKGSPAGAVFGKIVPDCFFLCEVNFHE